MRVNHAQLEIQAAVDWLPRVHLYETHRTRLFSLFSDVCYLFLFGLEVNLTWLNL